MMMKPKSVTNLLHYAFHSSILASKIKWELEWMSKSKFTFYIRQKSEFTFQDTCGNIPC